MRALTFRHGLNAKTVNNYVTVLQGALDMAVTDHALEDNRVEQVRYQRQQTPFPDPFTGDEVGAIIDQLTERYREGVANYAEFKFNSRARAALPRQRALTPLAGDFVFLDPRYGKPWTEERAFRRGYWEPTLKPLGLRYRRPDNTRHSYPTMMLMSGMTPAFCAAQRGHSVGMLPST